MNRLRMLVFSLLATALIGSTGGCGPTPTPIVLPVTAVPTATPLPSTPTPAPVILKDALGRQVKIAKAPERIVSLAPSNTEILFALGLGERVVGVTKFCNYPEEAKKKEQIGGFAPKTISAEKIVSLKPDLVLSAGAFQEPVIAELEKQGLTVFATAPKNLDEVLSAIETVGKITGREKEAKDLVSKIKERTEVVKSKVKDIPASKRPKVYWEVWDEPLMTAGPGTFIGDIIEIAGGVNIFADAAQQYPQISAEEVVKRNPDVIMAPKTHGAGVSLERLKARKGWATINAVKDGRVSLIEDDLVSRPGPRIVEGLEAVAKALYPDLFK